MLHSSSVCDFNFKDEASESVSMETDAFFPDEQILQIQKNGSRVYCWSWMAQGVLFLTSLLMLLQAISQMPSKSVNCVEKHSIPCEILWKLTNSKLIKCFTAPALEVVNDD